MAVVWPAVGLRALLMAVVASGISAQQHPCEAEVASACPDRPGAELAACLKDPDSHEVQTTLSSECVDFIALNVACHEDIQQHCDEDFFSGDTVTCLSEWTDKSSISEKCARVMRWAVPEVDEVVDDGPTDELGMSEKDHEEKKAWNNERRAARKEAIERMKKEDTLKEAERLELERLKKEQPEDYWNQVAIEEESKRQQAEMKRRERQIAAALERKKRVEAGLPPEEKTEAEKAEKKRKKREAKEEAKAKAQPSTEPGSLATSQSMATLCLVFLIAAGCIMGYFLVTQLGNSSTKGGSGKKAWKKGKKS